jgi:alkanesulfonate monooxygenase SsuD/methylene tetrahydromethanopterin reductase-like flavin-dependent oxidoreductase (luciferase family)
LISFGLMTYPPLPRHGRLSRVDLFRQTAIEAKAAEASRFASYWVGEHHFHEHFAAGPHPLMLLSFLAGQTATLRLGTAAILPALHHPVRLAEEIALADVLSDGRIEIGIGGGYSVEEFHGLGVPYGRRREIAWQVVDRMLLALRSGRSPIDREGAIAREVDVFPRPVQQPHPPILYCGYHRDSMIESLKRDLGFLFDPVCSIEKIVEKVALYRDLYAEHHGGAQPDRIAICRPFFIDRDSERAKAEGYRANEVYLDEYARLADREKWATSDSARIADPEQNDVGTGYDDWTQRVAIVGDPIEVADQIADLRDRTGVTDLIFWYHPTDHDLMLEAIRLFGESVIPKFSVAPVKSASL